VIRFGKWFGFEQSVIDMTPIIVEEYSNKILANNLSTNVNSVSELRKFIRFINPRLTTGLRLKRKQTFNKSLGTLNVSAELSTLTKTGFKAKSQELEELKKGRLEIAEQIKIAAADKDVRENSALEAARESLGKLEAQVKELETVLTKSQVVNEKTSKNLISIGSQVSLQETTNKKSSTYTIVAPIEASPLEMRISSQSPVGNALLRHKSGDIIEVKTPGGLVTYKIKKVR
jgi:transcription elongation factor GreA